MEASSSDYSDEEVGVIARGQKLWVRGVRSHTTCADIVRALQDAPEAECLSEPGEWVLAERWRGVERPLPPDVPVLHVLAAWGDARHEVRLSLRRLSSGGEDDSGRDSDGREAKEARGARRGRPRRRATTPPRDHPAARLVSVIQHQSRTIHQQLDKLREQEKLIDQLEDQTHKSRMEKHGTNYLLESYLRDLGRCSEVNDSQAANSDSGVGVGSGTPPRRHTKHKSRRERHLMREHYFTKELTDICQVNSERLTQTHNDTDSDASSDELTKIREEIELLEKLAIINKRLHREEELVVRLTAKVKRYTDENKANSCENVSQVAMLIDKIEEDLAKTAKEMQDNTIELEKADKELEYRMKLLDELTSQLEEEELQNTILERQLNEASSRQPIALQDSYIPVLDQSNPPVFTYTGNGYVLDTLV
ncbi:ras association domain-containing protein 10 [Colias croceus]|uniref:ras association domain-containing protein 10 n=1 Tax=Colias crocea TaxID=72248 RepID=UPI001E27ACED|nr:ras association domain-containing protein 10 [Colias croceus]XP_045504971.1 ras association domain-containing protein 10 [Colias croceus]XP_045504972.1 ras association domain-containing protein 10 [Colias croceus]XP_045504973.1 ras association domain-containing protein 10 [Colias croceus]XP_045504974.1 ras association domain-containing protein 10 [Colias croceus]XP_045504975.1 ras association domain-containing protein 10 [Colias croceus]